MAVRGEEVASSIDAQVRESIERMVAEIRSSVEDVRVLVDQQLKAALQSVQADVNSFTFLPQIKKSISDLEEQLESDRPAAVSVAAPAAAGPSAGALNVKSAAQIIERGRSQVDVLNSLLEQCLEFGSRAALLILRGETFSGWKGVGFTASGGNDETIKRFNAAPGLIPELDRVLRDEKVVRWDGVNLSTRFGVSASDTAVLVPMVIKDKVAAAVYVDAVGDAATTFDQAAIELLVFITGLLVDTLAIRKKIPSPSLTGESAPEHPAFDRTTTSGPAFASAPVAAPAAAAPAPPPAKPAPPPPAPEPETPIPLKTDAGTVAINAAQLREMMAAQRPSFNVPSAEDFGVASTPAPQPRVAPPAAPAPAPPPAAKAPVPEPPKAASAPNAATPSLGGGDERPSTQYIPPAGIARNAAAPASDDMKKHDEARRFARLLVSEIKLYNESKVEQGRKNNDLYERLKEDIDRSRQMYDERISDEVRKVSNYFYDELVRILADGRADALGL
jgi:hypothetical protein